MMKRLTGILHHQHDDSRPTEEDRFATPTSNNADTSAETVYKPAIVEEHVRQDRVVEVQPVIQREVERPVIHHVEKHIYEAEAPAGPSTITRPPIVEEHIRQVNIVEVQPVIHRTVTAPVVQQVQQHVTERVAPTQTTSPYASPILNAGPTRGVPYDYNNYYPLKPRERQLRPWVALASLIMLLFGIAQILSSVLSYGSLDHTWAYLASGVACTVSGFFGLLSALTFSRMLSGMFFVLTLVALLGSWAVLIIHSIFVDSFMDSECAERGGANCENVRDYYVATTAAFLAMAAVLPVITLALSGHYWRALSRARKGLPTSSVLPYGSARA